MTILVKCDECDDGYYMGEVVLGYGTDKFLESRYFMCDSCSGSGKIEAESDAENEEKNLIF